ncbi:MAG: YggT family protein [Candidatus Hydrogenedentes bacterium]|nr:YggT family protein [Candidatus Hydrogenedentota bacterium]
MSSQHVLASLVFSGLTLYMMALLLRWLETRLELEFRGILVVIPKACDPLIGLMKRVLPPMGPMDFSPMAAVISVYIIRLVLVGY